MDIEEKCLGGGDESEESVGAEIQGEIHVEPVRYLQGTVHVGQRVQGLLGVTHVHWANTAGHTHYTLARSLVTKSVEYF